MRVERFLTESANLHPGKAALVAGAKRMSFLELDRASDSLATALRLGGIHRDDRVVIFMDNCWKRSLPFSPR
jgi:acyl-CoA synthetase (AMP-forming)/AMP-acid ligase II